MLQKEPLALILGLHYFRSACFISTKDTAGSGILVLYRGKRFILSSFTVLGSANGPSEARFYFPTLSTPRRVILDPEKLHWAMKSLHFALVAISSLSLCDLKEVQPLELSNEECFNAMEVEVIHILSTREQPNDLEKSSAKLIEEKPGKRSWELQRYFESISFQQMLADEKLTIEDVENKFMACSEAKEQSYNRPNRIFPILFPGGNMVT